MRLEIGVSLAIPTTVKGNRILTACLSDIIYEKRTYKEASIHNKRLLYPSERSPQVDLYRQLYPRCGFTGAVRQIYWKKYYWFGFSDIMQVKLSDYLVSMVDRENLTGNSYKKLSITNIKDDTNEPYFSYNR